jgi:hypothetical protein
MSFSKISLNTSHLILYIELEQGVVFHKNKQSLYQLTALSISLLLTIDEGLSKQQSVEQVAKLSNLDESELIGPYDKVQCLFDEGLAEVSYIDAQYPELATIVKPYSVSRSSSLKTYQIDQATYSIETNSIDLQIEIFTLLRQCEKELTAIDFQVIITKCAENSHCFDIVCNELTIEKNIPFEYVMPHLIDRLQILSFQKSDYQYCFHGAALETEYGSLLLPGKSGAGKSTLSAILASGDSSLYSDEMIVLDDNFRMMTLNLPLAIKSGSWDLLGALYPELKNETIWHREDGRELKYIWPKRFVNSNNPNEFKTKKTLLINPCYIHNKMEISHHKIKLSVIETLMLMTGGGYQVASELTEDKIEQLFIFISDQPCFQLNYHSTEQALSQLEQLWQKN